MIEDPIDRIDKELEALRERERTLTADREALLKERAIWPKMIILPAGRGAWDDRVGEVFAKACGWTAEKNPLGDGMKYLFSRIDLYLEVHENGKIRVMGIRTSEGNLGRTPDKEAKLLPPVIDTA